MTVSPGESLRAIVLDIEGTTTPIDFVYQVLFPYARTRAASFLERTWNAPATQAATALLHRSWPPSNAKARAKVSHATGAEWTPATALPYVQSLMDEDRKLPGLKALQGLIWQEGFDAGELRGQVYDDVTPALARWKARGIPVYIYSSGSVLAQRLLFGTTAAGDLTPFLAGYFDTEIGSKKDPASYRAIATRTRMRASEMLFVSDVVSELDAARRCGMQTRLCVRGETPPDTGGHTVIHTFEELER